MSTLKIAMRIAFESHKDQTRFDGSPYITHSLRVMMKQTTEATRIIAILHDVVEDSSTTLEDLKTAGFDDSIISALSLLTHDPEIDYDVYIDRISSNRDAAIVKMSDLEDNSNIFEIPNLKPKDFERLIKYHRCWWKLKRSLGAAP